MTTGITSILKNILKFITFIGAVVAAVFLLRAFVIEPFVVPTGSMESTIEVGDCILAQKITLETGSDVTCSHPPCNFAARGGGFSLKATDVASIDELSPCAPRFRFL